MEELKDEVTRILNQECPVSRVNHLINTIAVNEDNVEAINEAINYLEMHESEIRRVRQLLMLKTRDHYFKVLKMKGPE
jgi:hypothetical protein